MPGINIVVGVDFGTTYSGVSWALATGTEDVRIINDWPNPHGVLANQDKVPSAITYDVKGQVSKWGYKVGINDTMAFRWMKIMLDPASKNLAETPHIKEMLARMDSMGKSVEDIVADYLACLWEYTIDHLKRENGNDFRELYTLKVVLTVPAVWSPMAKDKTLRAAKRAGMPVDIQLVTEPEAAVLALLKQKSDEQAVRVGDGFVVCDAGGGTVDLISYKVENLKPLKIRECVIGDGGLCGSVFLDPEFGEYIGMLAAIYAKTKQNDIREMFWGFVKRLFMDIREMLWGFVKRLFMPDATAPLTVDLKGSGDSPEIGIGDEQNIPREIFDFICHKVQALVEKQLQGIREKGISPKAVALVGGFGRSKYLHSYLKKANEKYGVVILQEPGAISTVCRGATLWGLEQNHATSFLSRIARISYGISFAVPYEPGNPNHHESDKWWDEAKDIWRAQHQMSWLLKRGDEVVEGHVLEGPSVQSLALTSADTGNWSNTDNLWYSDADIPPARQLDPSVKELCSVTYSIPYSEIREAPTYISAEKTWRDVCFSRDIMCGGANLEFRVTYNGRLVESVNAKYIDDF